MTAAPLLLVFVLGGATFSSAQVRDDRMPSLDLLQALNRWDRLPRIVHEMRPNFAIHMPDTDRYIPSREEDMSMVNSDKRSAVATALNAGRRRRQPTPALGKPVTPFVGVGVLNDMGSFFDSLRDNLETLASLSPQQRSSLFQDTPHVVQVPSTGGGDGMRRLHALRPLRPTSNIRSYNRRSDMQTYSTYPGANQHDPGLLWTGLGR